MSSLRTRKRKACGAVPDPPSHGPPQRACAVLSRGRPARRSLCSPTCFLFMLPRASAHLQTGIWSQGPARSSRSKLKVSLCHLSCIANCKTDALPCQGVAASNRPAYSTGRRSPQSIRSKNLELDEFMRLKPHPEEVFLTVNFFFLS